MESSMERERVFLRSTWEERAEAGLHLFESLGRTGLEIQQLQRELSIRVITWQKVQGIDD